jgi:hypothetical protein
MEFQMAQNGGVQIVQAARCRPGRVFHSAVRLLAA